MDGNPKGNKALMVGVVGILVATIALFAVILTGQGKEAEEVTPEVEVQSQNIVELASDTSDLSTLVTAVTAADLVTALSDESASFTVFAPTNTAFAEIQETVDALLMSEDISDLQDVLLYHVVPTAVLSGDLINGQTISTLGGETLKVRVIEGVVYINEARVISADIEASNGVVHVIDTVLVPGAFGDIVSVAQGTESLSTLVDSVVAADLVGALSDPNANLTVFAPANTAFVNIADTVAGLTPEQLTDVLLYHVVPSEAFSAQLSDGDEFETLNGSILTVSIEDGVVYIVGENSRAQVTLADVKTSNGVVHIIDTVLLP